MSENMQLSLENLENNLWDVGLNSHHSAKTERQKYLLFLENNQKKLTSKTVLNAISYVMHSYFFCMSNIERESCLNLLLQIDIKSLQNFGDLFDLLGILFKMAPSNKQDEIVNFLLKHAKMSLDNPSAIISICNSFSYIFDELKEEKKHLLINEIRYLIQNNSYSHLNDTLTFTLNLFTKGTDK